MGKKNICFSVMSLCFHLFSICIWLLEKKGIFLEVWDENKQHNHQDRPIPTESQLCSSRRVLCKKWTYYSREMAVGSLSPFLHLMETHSCMHGRCQFLQEGKKSPEQRAELKPGLRVYGLCAASQPQPWGGCVSLSIHSWFLQILTQMQILLVRNWRSKKSASFRSVWISDLFLFKSTVTCHPSMKPSVAFL